MKTHGSPTYQIWLALVSIIGSACQSQYRVLHLLATVLQVRLIVHVLYPSGQLTWEDLGEVIQALFDARTKWYRIGVQLKLPVGTLDVIQLEFSDTTDCLTEMCSHWLRRVDPRPSWEALTKALESPPVGKGHLAQQLRDKYCQGREETITHIYPSKYCIAGMRRPRYKACACAWCLLCLVVFTLGCYANR